MSCGLGEVRDMKRSARLIVTLCVVALVGACSGSSGPAQLSDLYGTWTKPNAKMSINARSWWKFWASDSIDYRNASSFVPRLFHAQIVSNRSDGFNRDHDRSQVTLGIRLSDELLACRFQVTADRAAFAVSGCLSELNGAWRRVE